MHLMKQATNRKRKETINHYKQVLRDYKVKYSAFCVNTELNLFCLLRLQMLLPVLDTQSVEAATHWGMRLIRVNEAKPDKS